MELVAIAVLRKSKAFFWTAAFISDCPGNGPAGHRAVAGIGVVASGRRDESAQQLRLRLRGLHDSGEREC